MTYKSMDETANMNISKSRQVDLREPWKQEKSMNLVSAVGITGSVGDI